MAIVFDCSWSGGCGLAPAGVGDGSATLILETIMMVIEEELSPPGDTALPSLAPARAGV